VIDLATARQIFIASREPFVKLLDLRLESVERGTVVVRLCDSAFYVALVSVYGPGHPAATATLTCSFLANARPPHDLLATATVIKPGRRIVYGDVRVTSDDRIVAHATMNFANLG